MNSVADNPRIQPLVEKVESFCRERPFTALALSFGIGVGVGASPFAGVVPLAALKGLRKLSEDPGASLAGKLSLATLAADFLMNASKLAGKRNGYAFDPLAEETLP